VKDKFEIKKMTFFSKTLKKKLKYQRWRRVVVLFFMYN